MQKIKIYVCCFVFITFVLTVFGCSSQPGEKEFYQMSKIPKDNETLANEKFSKYSVETQIDIYLFSLCCVEGSNHDYIRYLSTDGEKKVPQIVGRLDNTDNLRVKYDLIHSLYLIDYHCSSCIKENKDVMFILVKNNKQINHTDDDITKTYKELYNGVLSRLEPRK